MELALPTLVSHPPFLEPLSHEILKGKVSLYH